MSVLGQILEAVGIVVLGYFVLLNLAYLAFTVVAWRDLTRHKHSRGHAATEEALASPLSPPVSILLPAYNEEAGVVESVRSLLSLRYPEHEVIVINDGSTDSTLQRLKEEFDLVPVRKVLREGIPHAPVRSTYRSSRHPALWVIDKENGGKADALNCGVEASRYPFFCAVDGDTIIEEDALLKIAKPIMDDPDLVVATGGIVRIANGCRVEAGRVVEVGFPRSHLAAYQVVEYFRAFLVGRVAWSRLNSLLIISGAFGLFRRSMVEAVGGYSTATIGEDMELVVRLHRYLRDRGEDYRIIFVPDPVCWTEAPERIAVLGRQRRRWHQGMGETLWRHRRLIGNPRYGALGLSTMPFTVFELLGPVVEVVGYLAFPLGYMMGVVSLSMLGAFLILALLVGMLLSLSALLLEEVNFKRHTRHRDMLRLAGYAVLENFGYRQLTSWWRMRAFLDLALGRQEWGTMTRRGLTRPHPTAE